MAAGRLRPTCALGTLEIWRLTSRPGYRGRGHALTDRSSSADG
jgi:hypothetical protein